MTFPKGTTVLKAISHSQGKQILIFPVPSTYLQESTPDTVATCFPSCYLKPKGNNVNPI